MRMLWLFGILSGVFQAACFVPYARDIFKGDTRPHRGTWTIWCALSLIVLLSQRADGGTWSLLMAATQFFGTLFIALVSIRRGVGGTSRTELLLLATAGAGIVGWYVADDPTIATVFVVLSDTIAIALMLPKTYADPYSETLSTYVLSGLSGLFAVLAVGSFDFGLVIYPAYVIFADILVIVVAGARRSQLAAQPAPASE